MSNSGIKFDAATHTYWHGDSVVPGVTTILAPLTDFSKIPKMILKQASSFGTNVHAACDLWNKGQLDEAELDPGLVPYLDGYKRFLRATGFKVLQSEQIVFNEALGYAGTCDLVGEWKESSWVADIKSGKVQKAVGPQLSAYQHALDPQPRRRLVVALRANDYEITECKGLEDFQVFRSCLNVWKFKNAKSH